MSRYKQNQKGLPKDVKEEVQSICAGYYRRKRVATCRLSVMTGEPSEDFKAFLAWNERIDQAMEFIEEGIRPYILDDIANGKGYWRSMASPLIGVNAYYARKNKAIEDLAKTLNLMI